MAHPTLLAKKLNQILEIARFAPSVHNTQPWKVRVENWILYVELDPAYVLSDGDPTGRETVISLGIFCQALIMAAENEGLRLGKVQFMTDSAALTFHSRTSAKSKTTRENIALLQQRCTDRSIYQPVKLSASMLRSLRQAIKDKDVKIWVVTDPEQIETTAQLTSQGISVALSSPDFRKELSRYLTEPWSRQRRGIAVGSLYIPWIVAALEPLLMRLGLGVNSEAKLEKRRWQSASGIIYIATRGDMPEYWFRAGRAYLTLSLKIEKLGLSQATSAATVEASNFHEDIESMLGTNYRLQSVLRIGRGQQNRTYSPRVTAEELVATSN